MKIGTYNIEPIDFLIGGGLLFLLLGKNKSLSKMKDLPANFLEIVNNNDLTVIYTESGTADSIVKSNIEATIKRIKKEFGVKDVSFLFTDTNAVHTQYNVNGYLGDVFFISKTKFSQMQIQQTDINIMYDYASIVLV